MGQPIQFKRGNEVNLPSDLAVGEPAYTVDTNKLFVGTPNGPKDVLEKVNTQLADTTQDVQQVDFVKLLQEHNEVANELYVKKISDRSFDVAIPYKGDLSAYYKFFKDTNDDYIRFRDGYVATVSKQDTQTAVKNYDSDTGVWTKSTNNYYTTEVGATFTVSFYGTGIDFVHYADNRGGIWKFEVDGVEVAQVSVFSSTAVSNKVSIITRSLTLDNHTLVATFMGDDPANPPSSGAGTARGWVFYDVNNAYTNLKTTKIYEKMLSSTKKFDVFEPTSNKEFAFNVNPIGSGLTTEWIPEHNGKGSAKAVSQEIFFDNQLITDWTADTEMKTVKSIKVIQKMQGYHPDDPANPVCDFISIHTINSLGVSVKCKFKFIRQNTIAAGYNMMFPVVNGFAKRIITGYGIRQESIKTDSSATEINGEPISFAFINEGGTNGEPNTVAAMTVQDIKRTFRLGELGRRNNLIWLQHRSTLQKLYPQVFENFTANIGDTFEVGGTYFIGELPYASDVLPA